MGTCTGAYNLFSRQSRCIDGYVYELRVKGEDSFQLKIFNIEQRCLYKEPIVTQDLGKHSIDQIAKEGCNVFKMLVDKKLLPERYLPRPVESLSKESIVKLCDELIGSLNDIQGAIIGLSEGEAAMLDCVRLVQAQLDKGWIKEAIKILEVFHNPQKNHFPVIRILFELYLLDKNQEAFKMGQLLDDQIRGYQYEQKIDRLTCKRILKACPDCFSLYQCLAEHEKNRINKAHILLTGVCYALEEQRYDQVTLLLKSVKSVSAGGLLDNLVLMQAQADIGKELWTEAISIQYLSQLAQYFKAQGQIKEMIQCYKVLYRMEAKADYADKIYQGYVLIKKPIKANFWKGKFHENREEYDESLAIYDKILSDSLALFTKEQTAAIIRDVYRLDPKLEKVSPQLKQVISALRSIY